MPYIASLTGSIYHPRHRPMMSHDAAENPSLAPELVDAVAAHLEGREVRIALDLGMGDGRATVWTCDLTHGYIAINADYRS